MPVASGKEPERCQHQNGERVSLSLLTPFLHFSQKQCLLRSAIAAFCTLLLLLQLGYRDLLFSSFSLFFSFLVKKKSLIAS